MSGNKITNTITVPVGTLSVNDTLNERENNYGDFESQAAYAQRLKNTIQNHPNWDGMPGYVREAIEMMLHKISRIVNGNCGYIDSWHDIQGYAKLVETILSK